MLQANTKHAQKHEKKKKKLELETAVECDTKLDMPTDILEKLTKRMVIYGNNIETILSCSYTHDKQLGRCVKPNCSSHATTHTVQ